MAGAPPLPEEDAEAAWQLFVLGVEALPTHGDAEGAAWLRAQFQELGFTQGAFARFMVRRGDTRPKRNLQRGHQRMCAGKARVPGELRVLLGLMLRSKRKRMARIAKEKEECEAPRDDLSETRSEQREEGAPGASKGDPSGAPSRQEEREGPEASPGDLSETRGERRPPSGGMAGR